MGPCGTGAEVILISRPVAEQVQQGAEEFWGREVDPDGAVGLPVAPEV